MSHDVVVSGCVSAILGSYLKALAVQRLVSEQRDPSAVSWWDAAGHFHLVSTATRDDVVDFFLNRYAPTPIVTPWNGGSGFYAGDQHSGIDAISRSLDPRFARYRDVIGQCRQLLETLALKGKPADKQAKLQLLQQARSRLPDEVVAWLDAAFVVGDDARYPAILGTGGNDGRLDFANNFMQRLAELFLSADDRPGSTRRTTATSDALIASLFGDLRRGALQPAAAGQFAPALAGGTNMTAGLRTGGRVNPWDFILALEGALTFAGAAVKRLETGRYGSASFPFHVNPSPIGYSASSTADAEQERSCEIWLPLWSAPCTFAEIATLFGEARLEVGRRRATSGLDVARALATLGIDRGLDRFERVGIFRRNGLSYLATWLGTFPVRTVPRIDLLRDLDEWLASIERLDDAGPVTSAAFRRLQQAMFEDCRRDRPLTATLAAVGALERALARSVKNWRTARPLARLSPDWYGEANDGSPEFLVAAAVASWKIRAALEPVEAGRWSPRVRPVWTEGNTMQNIVAIARRRIVAAQPDALPLGGRSMISGPALRRLLAGTLDPDRLRDLVFGLSIVDGDLDGDASEPGDVADVDRVFCGLRAVTSPAFLAEDESRHPSPRTVTTILARLAARDVDGALAIAKRRLHSSGRPLAAPIREVRRARDVDTLAAALMIPLPHRLERSLIELVVKRPTEIAELTGGHR